MSTQEITEVRRFAAECIEAAGGVFEAANGAVAEALLPEALQPAFGGHSLIELAFDGQALESHPEAELLTVGTPALEALIAYAARHGTTTCGVIQTDRLRKKGFLETVQSEITLTGGCRLRHDERDQEARYAAYAVFHFRLSLVSDERRERVVILPVNLWSNRAAPELAEALPGLAVTTGRPWMIPDAPRAPIPDAFDTARAWLEGEVGRLQESYQARVLRRLEVDVARISDYYEGIATELRVRHEHEADDPERRRDLDAKIAAALDEKERKLRETAERYRLRTTVRLAAARLLAQPKVFGRFLIDRKQVTRELTLAYDPVLERLELPACESCCQPVHRLTVAGGKLVCPGCAG
ncbi:MAG: hypothetical protein HY321_10860 [Armatimonadetes bacterium]|nr:hypothetical protein [Armatimonadota bacterium]